MKGAPAEGVVEWVASQPASRLFTTAVTQGEILYGIGLLPKGKRRNRIAIAVTRRRKGRPMSQFDAQIAAIARSTGAAVATRNVVDFEDCGIDLVNPWQD